MKCPKLSDTTSNVAGWEPLNNIFCILKNGQTTISRVLQPSSRSSSAFQLIPRLNSIKLIGPALFEMWIKYNNMKERKENVPILFVVCSGDVRRHTHR